MDFGPAVPLGRIHYAETIRQHVHLGAAAGGAFFWSGA